MWVTGVQTCALPIYSSVAGSAPASAGKEVVQEQGGRAGVPQGDGWQLQDKVVGGAGAGLAMWPWGGHVHGLGMLG